MQYNHSRCKRIHITKDFQTEEIFTSKSIHTARTPTPHGYPRHNDTHAEWASTPNGFPAYFFLR